jgi:hypothetical protein
MEMIKRVKWSLLAVPSTAAVEHGEIFYTAQALS